MREAVRVSDKSPVLLDRFLDDAVEVDVDCIADGDGRDDRRHHGARRGRPASTRRLGLLAAARTRCPPNCRTTAPPDRRDGARAEGRRPDERAVRHPGGDDRGLSSPPPSTCWKVNPRASRTVPFVSKATGSRWPRSPRAAWPVQKLATRRDRKGEVPRSGPAVLQRQGSRLPVQQVPRRGPHPRPRDAFDRRSHGRGRHLRRGHAQSQLGAGSRLPTARARSASPVKDGDKPRRGGGPRPARAGLGVVATKGTAAAIAGRRAGEGGQQGQGRPPAHRRTMVKAARSSWCSPRSTRPHRDRRLAPHPPGGAGQPRHLLHHHGWLRGRGGGA